MRRQVLRCLVHFTLPGLKDPNLLRGLGLRNTYSSFPKPSCGKSRSCPTLFGASNFVTGAVFGAAFCFSLCLLSIHAESPNDISPVPRLSDSEIRKGVELVSPGTSSVPPFPITLSLPAAAPGATDDFALIGLGTRTVSFLKIQVYVVGFYVHTDDLLAFRSALFKQINAGTTAMTRSESKELQAILSHPIKGERIFGDLLSDRDNVQFRSLFRIVPTRNTDFQHLRDGWVRGIQRQSSKWLECDDESFSKSLATFKAIFGRAFKRSIPKQKVLVLQRDKVGCLHVFYDPTGRNDGGFGGSNEEQAVKLGEVDDYRVSKALWLCYLAGANPASEPARQSIIDGALGLIRSAN